jgi:hypothetical protein
MFLDNFLKNEKVFIVEKLHNLDKFQFPPPIYPELATKGPCQW